MNKRYWMLIGWLLITLALSGLAVMPAVWAASSSPDNWTVPTRTPTPGPPTEPPPPQPPTDPPTDPPVDPPPDTPVPGEPTVTPSPVGGTPTVTSTPSAGTPVATQTPAGTPSVDVATATAMPGGAGASPDSETTSPGVSATVSSSETASADADPASGETAALPAVTKQEQPAESAAPVGVSPEYSESGSGSWLFFGGVGLLLVGLVLLLVWRRQG